MEKISGSLPTSPTRWKDALKKISARGGPGGCTGACLRPSISVEDPHFLERLFGGERRNKPYRCGQSV